MSMPTIEKMKKSPHAEIAALLPWYVNGTLNPAEAADVEQHVAHCPDCRSDLEQCRILATRIPEQPATWQPGASGWDHLMQDIDALETPSAPAKTPATLLQRIRAGWRKTPKPMRWTLALESMAVAALVLMVALPTASLNQSGYETLSSSVEQPAVGGPRVRVFFAEEATLGEIQSLLRSLDGQIIAGPSALGGYTITLPVADRSQTALDQALAVLQSHHRVRLAEPLENGRAP